MSHIRSPHVLPFALLATLVAACSSSSSPLETGDSGGKKDTGTTGQMDSGTGGDTGGGHADTGTKHDSGTSGQMDTGTTPDVVTPVDAGSGPPVPATAKNVAKGLIDVLGITTDGYIVYYDTTGAVLAADSTGAVVTVAPAIDAGAVGYVGNVTGQYVWLLSDYTTVVSGGTTTPVAGTLSVWSHTLGALKPIGTKSTGIVNIATDGSAIVYTQNSDATGKFGDIAVVGATATGGAPILTNVGIDSLSTTCPPLAAIDKTYIVTSACTRVDGGTFDAAVVTSYNTATMTSTVLLTGAIPTNESAAPIAVDIATDNSGDNVLVVSKTGPTLAVQGIASAMATEQTILTPFSAPAMGESFFYLSKASTFALYTTPAGHLALSTFATPTSAPVNGTPYTDTTLGVVAISPDEKYDLDYSTPVDTGLGGYPTSLAIRNIQTGVANQLITAGSGDVGTFLSTFTDDVSYVFYTKGLVSVGSMATVGGLSAAPVATGVENVIEMPSAKVWNATSVPTVAKAIIYNKNYAPITLTTVPNGGATADMYITTADATTPGTLFITGADAPNDFYITPDGKNIFFTFSQVFQGTGDAAGQLGLFPTDGLYVMPIPAP